ncbi:MAG TPA: tetratricopeptide repeat protein [Phycisphaerae bacterium]|nr:tetratricopeptide repeat protein [Phycisphaerae bacterium]
MQNQRYQRAELLYRQSRYDQAIAELRQNLIDEPSDPDSHALLAICLTHFKDFNSAENEAAQAVQFAPDNAFAHYSMAWVLSRRKHWERAEVAIREALRLAPQNASYFAQLAEIQFNLERFQDALTSAEQGMAIQPDNASCRNLRSMALIKLNRKQEAIWTTEGTLQSHPNDALTHANQGWAYLHQKNYRQAMEHFREALRINPNLEWARQGMLTALKAKYFIYRWMLSYLLFMSRLNRRSRWLVVIGIWFSVQVIGRTASLVNLPVSLLIAAYFAFVFLSWTADPIFNLLIYFNRYGKYLLTTNQRQGAMVSLALLIAAPIFLVIGIVISSRSLLFLAAATALLLIPTSAVFRLSGGWQRIVMAVVTIFLAILIVAFAITPGGAPPNAWIPLLVVIAMSTLIANIIGSIRKRY